MSAGFTPGPWVARPVRDADFTHEVYGPGAIEVAAIFGVSRPDSEANARLIAAAPELYEALEAAERVVEQSFAGAENAARERALPQIRAALAKARGEA